MEWNPYNIQAQVLAAIYGQPATCNTTLLSKQLDITYSHMSHVIKDLERRGLIYLEENGRRKDISLNEDYMELFEDVAHGVSALDQLEEVGQ